MSLLFTATYPQRVAGLVLCGAAARWTAAPGYPHGRDTEAMLDALEQTAVRSWGQGNTLEWYAPSHADADRARQTMARRERMSISPSAYLRMLRMVRDIDVRNVLPAVTAPTLVVQRHNDHISPPGLGRYLAENIPNATYLEQKGDHLLGLGDVGELANSIERLVVEAANRRATTNRMLATILVTTTSGTAAPPHQPTARDAVHRLRGQLIQTTTQGLVATFDGAARAIRCALAIRADPTASGFRAGIHAGEVELSDGQLTGSALDLAHQVFRLAEEGHPRLTHCQRPGDRLVARVPRTRQPPNWWQG